MSTSIDHVYLAEEAERLADTDAWDSIARRLGYKNARNLARVLYKWGYVDLAQRVEHLEPLYPKRSWSSK